MSKLVWDQTGERFYETGVRNGVLYPVDATGAYSTGVAWNGLTSVTETPSGADSNPIYADDIKYLDLRSKEEFGGTIEAYTYPDEFAICDGSASLSQGVVIGQQTRKPFGFCYRTVVGNDAEREDYGYKLHIVYGATASPSDRQYQTINDNPEAINFSWEFTTVPVAVTGYKDTALLTIESKKVGSAGMKAIEKVLYGDTNVEPRLPLPDEVASIITEAEEES